MMRCMCQVVGFRPHQAQNPCHGCQHRDCGVFLVQQVQGFHSLGLGPQRSRGLREHARDNHDWAMHVQRNCLAALVCTARLA